MVQYECEGDTCQDEKIDALQLEVCVRVCVCVCVCVCVFDTLPSSYHLNKSFSYSIHIY